MNKSILLLNLLLVICLSANAQRVNTSKIFNVEKIPKAPKAYFEKGFRGNVQIAYPLEASLTLGYQFNYHLSVGGGVGVKDYKYDYFSSYYDSYFEEYYSDYGNYTDTGLLLFLSGRYNFTKGHIVPFAAGRVGKIVNDEFFMFNPRAGVTFTKRGKLGFSIFAGYEFWTGNAKSRPQIGVGIEF